MEIDDIILKYVLQNAIKFDGKAQVGAVIGKVFSEQPELKAQSKELSKKIQETIKEISKLSVEEQTAKLKELAPELLEKKKVEKNQLQELDNAEMGKVVTRIPPEPSKYNHLGHAMSFLINYMYAKKYEGKCILRFEDTNPNTSEQEYVDAMKSDVLEYLDIEVDKTVFASDDLPKFYEYADKLIDDGKAYFCVCPSNKMRDNRQKGIACSCSKADIEATKKGWKEMLDSKHEEGKAVLRLRGDMESDNHVMRDPIIFRINYAEHYRQKDKYCVWPMYDFENAIEDSINGVTHVMRSSEFGKMRIELQTYIKELLGLPNQEVIHYGRINIIGTVSQGREIRAMIEEGKVSGWDDPRLVTLRALKRRGIDPRTFRNLVYKVGLSLAPTNLDWDIVSAENRKIIDKEVNRYFFIENPKLIKIKGAPEQEVKLELHPDFEDRGHRAFKTNDSFYIAEKDLKVLKKGKLYRFMDCLNFVKKGDEFVFDSLEYEKYKDKGERIMHWLPAEGNIDVEILMPDSSVIKGLGECTMANIAEGEVIQAERYGFMRLDDKKTMRFWYTHK